MWSLLMKLCRYTAQALVKPFGIEIQDAQWLVIEQFIKFVFVGCSNAVITLCVYYSVVIAFGEKMYMVGQTLGYIAGIFNSYFWNSRFVFEGESENKIMTFGKMTICYVSTYFIQMGLLYTFVQIFNISALISPILAIIITTPINFILNKIWTFQNKG